MSTRAIQIEVLATPLIDPTTGELASGYTAYFYAAGTSTAKNVWTEKEKTNPFTSYTLDSGAKALLYGDGIYKIIVKNTDGTAVLTLDNLKIQATTFSVSQKSGAYTATPDDDVLLCDGTFTVSLQTVTNFEHPLIIKNIGTGTITVDPYSSETIDGSSTVDLSATNSLIRIYPDTTSNIWRLDAFLTDLNGTELILDADGDTSITADTDDQIDIKIGGTDEVHIDATAVYPEADGTGQDLGKSAKQWQHLYLKGNIVWNGVTRNIQSASPSNAASVTFSGLVDGAMYRLDWCFPTKGAAITTTFNADSGNNYDFAYDYTNQAAETINGGDNQQYIPFDAGSSPSIGSAVIFISGNNAHVNCQSTMFASDVAIVWKSGGSYSGASAVTSVTLSATGTTGKVTLERLI